MMQPRINVITLGVEDIRKSRKFYEDLGFTASSTSNEHFVAFQASGIILCLYPTKLLAEDAKVNASREGFRGVTLAYNVKEKKEVTSILEQAEKFGAKIMKPAQDVFWGGHSGYFADLDGHLWEVAWNPHWSLEEDGMVRLPT
jgi:predicted lactoylglutathione lyase